MSIEFRQIVLYTSNKDLLIQQLSDLFDSEVIISDLGVKLQHCGITLMIMEDQWLEISPNDSVTFDYFVSSNEELMELLQKVEFFMYRHSDFFKHPKVPQVYSIENYQYFVFTDVDGRKWKFFHC